MSLAPTVPDDLTAQRSALTDTRSGTRYRPT